MMQFLNVKNVFLVTSISAKRVKRFASSSNLAERTITVPTISTRHKLPYKITYFDSAEMISNNNQSPTILLIHGTPGTYKDYNLQLEFFQNKGIRVISPNFPDYRYIHESGMRYCHNPEDRANFVRSLLHHLNIEKIDLLVGHSSGVYPSLLLANSNSQPKVSSLALLNPATHMISKVLKPLIFSQIMVFLGKRKSTYKTFDYLTKLFKISLAPVKTTGIDHPLYAVTTLMTADLKKVRNIYKSLQETKFPMLLAYSGNDKLFELEVYKDLEKILVPDPQLLQGVLAKYNESGEIIQESTRQKEWIRILHLEKGSHYCMWKHPEIINEHLLQLLQKVT